MSASPATPATVTKAQQTALRKLANLADRQGRIYSNKLRGSGIREDALTRLILAGYLHHVRPDRDSLLLSYPYFTLTEKAQAIL